MSKNDTKKALEHFKQALPLLKQIDNPTILLHYYDKVGDIHYEQQDFEEALNYFGWALTYAELLDNTGIIVTIYTAIGAIYHEWEEWDEASKYYKRALSLLVKKRVNREKIYTRIEILADVYRRQGRLKRALSYYELALPIIKQVGQPAHLIQAFNEIDDIYDIFEEVRESWIFTL